MDFLVLEAEVNNSDDNDSFIYSVDDNCSLIDDASDISESVCEHCAFQNVELNIDDVLKNAHKKAISDLDNASEFINFSNPDLAEELPETVTFCGQEKRVIDFEKSLLIPHGVGSIDSFSYAICYARSCDKQEMKKKLFLAASWKNIEALILLALNTAEGNKLSFRPLISYIAQ